MQDQQTWNAVADQSTVDETIASLEKNGITAISVQTGEEAKKKVLDIIPQGAEVMTMTSITLSTIGITEAINESGNYNAVHKKLASMDRNTQSMEMQKLGSAPEWSVASVHAITEEGHIFIASNTGSQLPAAAYGSAHAIFVVGTQKIVKDANEATKRIYEYILPLETKRAREAYGLPDTWDSFVSKLLIINREVNKQRITVIFVNEVLGL